MKFQPMATSKQTDAAQFLTQLQFSVAAPHLGALPADDRPEIAFAGRSNAGKSSAVNAICARRKLARVSKTPGRTRAINFFQHEHMRLADLPGYGFARVPPAMQAAWKTLVESYLTERRCLLGVVLVMDVRHPLTAFDEQLLAWGASVELPFHLLLTKADKLAHNRRVNTLRAVRRAAEPHAAQLFSATRGMGVAQARAALLDWLDAAGETGKPPAAERR